MGNPSKRLRGGFLKLLYPHQFGKNINIGRKVYLGDFSNIRLGNHSSLGANFRMHQARVEIGNYVMTAEDVLVLGGGHRYADLDTPMVLQGEYPITRLTVEDDVWIGRRSIILAKNITIGRGAIIGAGAVVTKNVPPYSIVAGNPAKIIGWRKNPNP